MSLWDRLRRHSPSGVSTSIDDNRAYWDAYGRAWADWAKEFRGFEVEEPAGQGGEYRHLGDEWGHPEHVQDILARYVFPFVDEQSNVVEIGAGGGRLAIEVAPRVRHLHCLDISAEMLSHLRQLLGTRENVTIDLIEDARLPEGLLEGAIDFVYSFDVFVHLDIHTMWAYMRQAEQALQPGGRAFFHTANLLTQRGWDRFASQERFSVEGHYFVTPEIVRRLTERAGFVIDVESTEDAANFYTARDYLVVLRKRRGAGD